MKSQIDPYKILFPVGILCGLFGIALWPLFSLRVISFYPLDAHAFIMFFSFLWSFVAGFLMTAIPRMTQTEKAGNIEIFLAVFMATAQVLANFLQYFNVSIAILVMQTLFLIFFITRRFLVHRRVPFFGVLFIPFSFLQSLAGVVIYLFVHPTNLKSLYLFSGEAFVLNLILGVGSRLIPVISRLPGAVMPDEMGADKKIFSYLSLALILNLSFYVQAFYSTPVGLAIRFLLILAMSIRVFKIYTNTKPTTFVGLGLRVGVLFICAAYLASLYLGEVSVPARHLLFIGGFALITLMVATRVVLAHGGVSLDYELKSKRILSIVFLVLLSAVLRYVAGSNISSLFMWAAELSLSLALILWIWKSFKVYSSGSKSHESR